ncbi:MAG: hypothetical protein HQL53_07145, partial [Magnetococcales bacterium]|nr:hypothetical protein [Magnetococcales bacterium]
MRSNLNWIAMVMVLAAVLGAAGCSSSLLSAVSQETLEDRALQDKVTDAEISAAI